MRKMKNSGVPWIGEIPEDWDACQIGRMIRFTSGQALPSEKIESESGEYKVYGGNGLRGYTDSCFLHGEYVLIGRQGAQCGNVHVVSGDFWATEHALIAYEDLPLNRHWLFYILTSMDLNQYSTSAAQPGLAAEQIRKKYFCIPPIHEQDYIASYLDKKCSRIDTTIANIRILIDKLKEYKQSIITEAVTKGLNHDVPMKDSGVPWIGEIPKEWHVVPMTKQLENIVDYRGKTPEKVDEGIFLVTAKNIKFGRIDYEISKEYIPYNSYATVMSRGIPEIGDILFTTEAPLGEVAIVDNPKIALAQRVIKLRVIDSLLFNVYLKYWIMSSGFQYFLSTLSTGSTAAGIKASKLFMLQIALPTLQEQRDIADYLDTKCAKIDSQISEQESLLTKLEAYKKSLIYECVTGKREVPAA